MRTSMPKIGRSAYCSVREASWILGVETSVTSRLIRVGALRVVRRRGRLSVSSSALARLLGEPMKSGGTP